MLNVTQQLNASVLVTDRVLLTSINNAFLNAVSIFEECGGLSGDNSLQAKHDTRLSRSQVESVGHLSLVGEPILLLQFGGNARIAVRCGFDRVNANDLSDLALARIARCLRSAIEGIITDSRKVKIDSGVIEIGPFAYVGPEYVRSPKIGEDSVNQEKREVLERFAESVDVSFHLLGFVWVALGYRKIEVLPHSLPSLCHCLQVEAH